jgi:hypothetical protein
VGQNLSGRCQLPSARLLFCMGGETGSGGGSWLGRSLTGLGTQLPLTVLHSSPPPFSLLSLPHFRNDTVRICDWWEADVSEPAGPVLAISPPGLAMAALAIPSQTGPGRWTGPLGARVVGSALPALLTALSVC